MVSRKRDRQEMEAEDAPHAPSLLQQIRDIPEFAALMQYVWFFGKTVKIGEDFDIQEMETECLKPTHSEKLSQIGLALLKLVSSHRGLTPDIFDEYTRRQYVAKAPQRNPFGTEETPKPFADFDIFTKIRVLHQLSIWTFNHPTRIREMMPEANSEEWRIEPAGWDEAGNEYVILDDNRLYRQTWPPEPEDPPPKRKAKPKPKKSKGTRASKRRKVSEEEVDDAEEEEQTTTQTQLNPDEYGPATWECVAVTLEEWQAFAESIRRTRDPDQKALYQYIIDEALPSVVAEAEEQQRKEAKRLRELENLQKLATAKRSSRIAGRMEKQREIEEAEATERKRQEDLAMARKEQERQRKMEEARESRMMTREQRLKEREMKRILHEEELKKLEEESKNVEKSEAHRSERHLKAEMEKRKKELERLEQEDEHWVFDCSGCGVHGQDFDDGTHSIACEKCNVWHHSACHGIAEKEASRPEFHFVCRDCKLLADQAKQPKITLKIRQTTSASPKGTPKAKSHASSPPIANGITSPPNLYYTLDHVRIPIQPSALTATPRTPASVMNGPSLSPQGQASGPPGAYRPNGVFNMTPQGMNRVLPMSPPRPTSSGVPNGYPMPNGIPNASAPQWRRPVEYANGHTYPPPYQNGSPYGNGTHAPPPQQLHNPFMNTFNAPPRQSPQAPPQYGNSFGSPTKRASMSPNHSHQRVVSNPLASSPNSSFPPPTTQRTPSQGPMKQASSPPPPRPASSHTPLPATSSGYSPQKHDGARPSSSHSFSETSVLPPSVSFSAKSTPQILSPPEKKMTPERPPMTSSFQASLPGSPMTRIQNSPSIAAAGQTPSSLAVQAANTFTAQSLSPTPGVVKTQNGGSFHVPPPKSPLVGVVNANASSPPASSDPKGSATPTPMVGVQTSGPPSTPSHH